MENRLFLGVFFISTASGALFGESLDELSVRRFGLYVASNDGGGGRQRLLYAEDDVNTVSRMMAELGGLAPRDGVRLFEPDSGGMEEALDRLGESISQAGEARRTEIIFYYSGHSNEQGLMLVRITTATAAFGTG